VTRILTVAGFADIAIVPFDAAVPFGEGRTRDAATNDAVRMAIESARCRAWLLLSPIVTSWHTIQQADWEAAIARNFCPHAQ